MFKGYERITLSSSSNQGGKFIKTKAGKVLNFDYNKTAKSHGLEDTHSPLTQLDNFPIELARLRSSFYINFLAISATISYGWVVEKGVVCYYPRSPLPTGSHRMRLIVQVLARSSATRYPGDRRVQH